MTRHLLAFAALALLNVSCAMHSSSTPLAAGTKPDIRTPIPPVNVPPPERTLDRVLDELEELRNAKAELEKREAVLIQEAQRGVAIFAARARKLGVAPPPAPELTTPPPVPNPR